MEFLYTQNPAAKVPIMVIDQYIGMDEKGVMGLSGSQFSKEIFALKNAGKTEVEVLINSKGGQWSEGVSVVGAMRNSGISFTTVNMGYVDSTAGHIYQQGGKRKWMNYGLGLVHNIQGKASESIIEAMNTSIAVMLSEKSKKSAQEVREMMNAETMMTARMAEEYGFCDEVINCTDILSFTNSSDIKEITSFGEKQIQKTLPKKSNMESINQLLGLTNEANEDSTRKAITSIIEARNAAEAKVTSLENTLQTTSASLTETTNKLNAANESILQAQNAAKKTAAEALVKEHTGKRIASDPAVIAKWVDMATNDLEGTKTIIEGINYNATAPKKPGEDGKRGATAPVISVGEYMSKPERTF